MKPKQLCAGEGDTSNCVSIPSRRYFPMRLVDRFPAKRNTTLQRPKLILLSVRSSFPSICNCAKIFGALAEGVDFLQSIGEGPTPQLTMNNVFVDEKDFCYLADYGIDALRALVERSYDGP